MNISNLNLFMLVNYCKILYLRGLNLAYYFNETEAKSHKSEQLILQF